MNLKISLLTEEYAKQICSWRYEKIYSVYNYPAWNILFKQGWGITLEDKRESEFASTLNEKGELCGYMRFINKEQYVVVGVGLRPDLCGKGLGMEIMKTLKEESQKRFGQKKIMLQVRSFNKRAIKCYERAGFKTVDACIKDTPMGMDEFMKMEYDWLGK